MGKRLLVVDDCEPVREMLAAMLASRGYAVVAAEDGGSALKALQSSPFDLILTDLDMPGMDGLAFAAALRAIPGCETTPVVVLSAHADSVYRDRGHQAGVVEWLAKPCPLADLVATVERHC